MVVLVLLVVCPHEVTPAWTLAEELFLLSSIPPAPLSEYFRDKLPVVNLARIEAVAPRAHLRLDICIFGIQNLVQFLKNLLIDFVKKVSLFVSVLVEVIAALRRDLEVLK